MKRIKWTLNLLQDEANKYITQQDFKNGSPKAHKAAYRRGLLPEICKHMIRLREKYTDEKVKELAQKCKTRKEFIEKYSGAYTYMQNNKLAEWLNEKFPLLCKKWTVSEIYELADKCTTRNEFRVNGGVYDAAKRLGIYAKIAQKLEGRESWTTEKLMDAARQYSTRAEFREQNPAAAIAAGRRGVMNEVCSHMQLLKRDKWKLEEMVELAKQYNSRSEFEKAHAGAYTVMLDNGWKKEVCEHMEYICRPKWTKKELKEVADKYTTIKEFDANEHGAYIKICKEGLIDELCKHMKRAIRKFTKSELVAEITKYSTLKELCAADSTIYQQARLCEEGREALSKLGRLHRTKWTEEAIYIEASGFADQSAFVNSNAYNAASKKGILQEVLATLPEGDSARKIDTIYIWKVEGYEELYKIGVTCSHTKSDRTREVAKFGGLKIEKLLIRKKVGLIANKIESDLLGIGEYAIMDSKFNGSTEFRYMNKQQLKEAMDKIEGV